MPSSSQLQTNCKQHQKSIYFILETWYNILKGGKAMTLLNTKEIEAIENLDWGVSKRNQEEPNQGECYLFTNFSPEGEDISFEVQGKTGDEIALAVRNEAECFDVDDHVELWVDSRGSYGVPSSISTLVEDAQEIEKMLNELADTLDSVHFKK